MTIVSTVNGLPKTKTFPKLMESVVSTNLIVLFSLEGVGTVVSGGVSSHIVGYHTPTWDMYAFKDFEGTLTLENK